MVETFFDSLTNALARERELKFVVYAAFFIKTYDSYTGRNPKTGEKVTIPPKKLPFFKCGKELKEMVDKEKVDL